MLGTLMMMAAASSPHIDLYTMGQGGHVFERFGHAAVCVTRDDRPEQSRCYNYGTTDFGAPGRLAWNFLRGDARFWVAVWPERNMVRVYVRADRSLWRQRLPLTPTQVQAFEAKLEHDALEENRYYVYHHFSDNCTTRIRDILDDVTDGSLSRRGARPLGTTYRELGAQGLADHTMARVVSDFVLGRAADAPITVYDGMFHPDILREEVAATYGVQPEVVYARRGPPFPRTGTAGRHWTALLAALIVAPVVAGEWLTRWRRFFLALSGGALGLIATLLWGLAIISTVPELRWNEALLLFWPTDFVLPFLAIERVRRYARVRLLSVAIVSALTASGVLWQPLFAPLLLPLAVFGVLAWPSPTETGARPGSVRATGRPAGAGSD